MCVHELQSESVFGGKGMGGQKYQCVDMYVESMSVYIVRGAEVSVCGYVCGVYDCIQYIVRGQEYLCVDMCVESMSVYIVNKGRISADGCR